MHFAVKSAFYHSKYHIQRLLYSRGSKCELHSDNLQGVLRLISLSRVKDVPLLGIITVYEGPSVVSGYALCIKRIPQFDFKSALKLYAVHIVIFISRSLQDSPS